ncbi:MAG: Ig-like domain-containing protein [Bacteroidales bacterium]|nr:Ig-like domain-containing protein [Bacteroidales bacterium]
MMEGESYTLTATVSPSNADNKTVLWTSSNASVATVNKGTVTAVSPGNAIITATSDDGGKTATCSVVVTSKVIKVTEISLSQNNASLGVGDGLSLEATVLPENATNKVVRWNSSNNDVAFIASVSVVDAGSGYNGGGTTRGEGDPDTKTGEGVSSIANIVASKAGTAVITARTDDGGYIAQCEIVVSVSVTGLTLSESELTLDAGESKTIMANVTPADATDKEVSWTSSDQDVVTVDGGKVTGVKPGTAVITAITHDGGITASCTVTVITHAQGVSLNKTSLILDCGSSEQLTATIRPDNASNVAVRWSSSNQTVATVSDGLVTGKSAGNADIVVTTEDGEFTATCKVNVIVSVTELSLEPKTLSMTAGETRSLSLNILPADATERNITWRSSNTSVATVKDGLISALNSGTTTITAESENGITASCLVSVVVPVSGISISPQSVTLDRNKRIQLTATVLPENATEKGISWSSSDPAVATVTDGEVTAKSIGSAKIIATTKDGGKTAICEVTVIVSVTELSLEPKTLSMKRGDSQALTLTITPSDATDKAISWSSSTPSVATVNDGVVTAIKGGTSTITATATNGVSASCIVTVFVAPTGVTVTPETLTLEEKTSGKVTATVLPDDVTDKTVLWSSSNPSVATVSENGIVQALTPGTADIIATTKDGAFSANCALTVEKEKPMPTSLSFAAPALFVDGGDSYSLAVSVKPEDARGNFTWKSSNNNAVTVTGNGASATVTSNYTSTGYTTVTVTDQRSGRSASIKVYSYVPNFYWNESTGDTYSGYPLITIPVGGTHQLKYTSDAGSNILNLFSNRNDGNWVFYESGGVSGPSYISVSPEGLVTGIKEGTTGIKPTGGVQGSGRRVYIKVANAIYESEYNDDQSHANTIPFGMPMQFRLSNASDVDWFKLLVDSPSYGQMNVTISVEYMGASSMEGTKICKYSLYDSSMQLWGSGSFSFNQSSPIASTDRNVPAGPLYLKVYFDTTYNSGFLPFSDMVIRMTVH